MKLIFKQRFFSWLDSYDIYTEQGEVAYTVKGQLSWGHCLKVFDPAGWEIGTVKEEVFTLLPRFQIYLGETRVGCIRKELTFLKPKFTVDYNGWSVAGNWMEWDYTILDGSNQEVASISKQVLNWTDTYVLDIRDPQNAVGVLMIALAIDADKCSRQDD